MIEITCPNAPASLARTAPSGRPSLRLGVVQHRWHSSAAALRAELNDGIDRAARLGATVVFLPELTLSRYPADQVPENDLALQVKMTDVLALAVGYSVHHNTDPPAGFEKTDTLTTINLVYEIK